MLGLFCFRMSLMLFETHRNIVRKIYCAFQAMPLEPYVIRLCRSAAVKRTPLSFARRVRDCSGILCTRSANGAGKDRAESPTRSGTPKKERLKSNGSEELCFPVVDIKKAVDTFHCFLFLLKIQFT